MDAQKRKKALNKWYLDINFLVILALFLGIAGWFGMILPIYWSFSHGGIAIISFNSFGELWFEFVMFQIIFIIIIITLILFVRKIRRNL